MPRWTLNINQVSTCTHVTYSMLYILNMHYRLICSDIISALWKFTLHILENMIRPRPVTVLCPSPPHHLLLPSLEAPGTGGTGWGRRGREGGRKSEASNSITGKTRLEQWFTCWSCALLWEHVLCNVEAVHWWPVQIGGGWCSACGLVTGGKV